MDRSHFMLFAILLSVISPAETQAQERDALIVSAGVFDVEEPHPSAEFRLEYHPGVRVFEDSLWPGFQGFGPVIGLMVNHDEGIFGYGGVQTDIPLDEDWVVTPAVGIGGYDQADSADLGGIFQFHLGLTVAYRIADGHRLGLSYAHISNGATHDANPGSNSVLVSYRVAFDGLF